MDTFFIPHAFSQRQFSETPSWSFLKMWQEKTFQPKPKSILIISAHWDTSEPTVNVPVDRNDTIYDFEGFPESVYELKYPAPAAPNLAMRVKKLLMNSGFENVKEDQTSGLDHGAWFPLRLMYPEADIPVCQLSIQPKMDATYHYNMGKALNSLRDEEVLIIGSGGATNNMTEIDHGDGPIFSWALEFNTWVTESLLNGRHEDLIQFEKVPSAKIAHPEPDHFYPLLIVLGAAGEGTKAEIIHDSWDKRCVSFAACRFTANAQ